MNNLNHLIYEIDQQGFIPALSEGLEGLTNTLQIEFKESIRQHGSLESHHLAHLGLVTNKILYQISDYYHVIHDDQGLVIDADGYGITEQEQEKSLSELTHQRHIYEANAL